MLIFKHFDPSLSSTPTQPLEIERNKRCFKDKIKLFREGNNFFALFITQFSLNNYSF